MGHSQDLNGRPDLVHALGRLESERVESRQGVLLELRRLIVDGRQRSAVKQIDDKGYHAILESIFRLVKADISNLVRATKYTSSKISSRLATCANVVRTIVDVGLLKLRHRTVKAVAEHVCQSLATPGLVYCEPLSIDYFKALAILLGHKAHVEHFVPDEWGDLARFIIQCVEDLNNVRPSESSKPLSRTSSLFIRRQETNGTASPDDTSSLKNLTFPHLQSSNETILSCLRHLVSATNAPVIERSENILDVVVHLLQIYPHQSKIQQSAYEILELVLSRTLVSNLDLSARTIATCISLARKMWPRASHSQREAMLSVFIRCRLLLPQMTETSLDEELEQHVSDLLDVLKDQYSSRNAREQLTIDDICFPEVYMNGEQPAMLRLKSTSLRSGSLKSEEPWSVIYVSAALYVVLDKLVMYPQSLPNDHRSSTSAKRRKRSSPFLDLLQSVRTAAFAPKIYALQIFVAYVDFLTSFLSTDDSVVLSWTILSFIGLIHQEIPASKKHEIAWDQIWKLISRHITSANTCRVASHALSLLLEEDLVDKSLISDSFESVRASSLLNGPAECDSASCRLFEGFLILRHKQSLRIDVISARAVLQWLYKSWSPGKIFDRAHTSYASRNISTIGLISLVCLCLGMPRYTPSSWLVRGRGRLSQAFMASQKSDGLVKYLLYEVEVPRSEAKAQNDRDAALLQGGFSEKASTELMTSFLDFLDRECKTICLALFTDQSTSLLGVGIDTLQVILQLCIVGYGILSCLSTEHPRYRTMDKLLDNLRGGLTSSIVRMSGQNDIITPIIEFLGPLIGSVSMEEESDYPLTRGLRTCARVMDKQFWDTLGSQPLTLATWEDEPHSMDVDVEFESQMSQSMLPVSQLDVLHDRIAAISSAEAYRACVIAKLQWLSTLGQAETSSKITMLVNYLTSLKKEDFVLCTAFVLEMVQARDLFSEDDVDTLLQYMQQVIVRTYELEYSEVSIGICTGILVNFSHWWTLNDGGDLAQTSAELYIWFAQKLQSNACLSPAALAHVSELTQQVVQISPDYMKELSLPSARTLLLKILDQSDLTVKYTIGTRVADIFGRFVLKEHSNILEDIINTLPKDPTWREGIALRFQILGHLAAAWPTLLRRCMYAIFETAGHVPSFIRYGSICVAHVSGRLGLQNSRQLFELFAPQLLYTWLETQKLENIPYTIFGYATIQDLLVESQHEIVGQLIMRDKANEYEFLRSQLNKPFKDILVQSFSSAAGYCISRDIAISPSPETGAHSAEKRLVDAVGQDEYVLLTRESFAAILSLFLIKADNEDQIQRAFDKISFYAEAKNIYQQIFAAGHSDTPLPPSQQPSFKMKYLPMQIRHLCTRTSQKVDNIWTPSLYVLLFRNLTTCMHAAYGSLHSCAILKKIRILVSMAGSVAVNGYALEMALHALRPFLTDLQCTDEAVGLLQYLLEQGSKALMEVPSFLLGHATSTLIQLKAFLDSKQDSTTQTSQFQVTMSRAQAYQKWLLAYLSRYESSQLSTTSLSQFQNIVRAASNLQHRGNARSGTCESELLMSVLKELQSGQGLLSRLCIDSIFKFLNDSFEGHIDFRCDVLGEDDEAASFVDAVWSTCHSPYATSEYLLWAARVIGRSYASHSSLEMQLVRESGTDTGLSYGGSRTTKLLIHSQASILNLLSRLLTSDDHKQIGWAEMALRSAVTKAHGTEQATDYEKCLGTSLFEAMLCLDDGLKLHTQPENIENPEAQLHGVPHPTRNVDAEQWIRSLSEALTAITRSDPLMIALRSVLRKVRHLAKDAFPFILHLALLSENEGPSFVKSKLSDIYRRSFEECRANNANVEIVKTLLSAFLYLRSQPIPHEMTKSDRVRWLEFDFRQAAYAAERCAMFKTSLLLLDIEDSEKTKADSMNKKRSRIQRDPVAPPGDVLLNCYQNLDEKDAFYGVKQSPTLSSIMAQLDYEEAGVKSLSFRSAFLDTEIWQSDGSRGINQEHMMRNLSALSLDGLTQLLSEKISEKNLNTWSYNLNSARRLELWDVNPPDTTEDGVGSVFGTFRLLNNANSITHISTALNNGFGDCMQKLLNVISKGRSSKSVLTNLAVLVDIEELVTSQGETQLNDTALRFKKRNKLLEPLDIDSAREICSCRGTLFSSISKRSRLRELLKLTLHQARLMECETLLHSASLSRAHDALQDALSSAARLHDLVDPCLRVGIDVSAASAFESARLLWSHGEKNAAVNMLNELNQTSTAESLQSQAVYVGKAGLLAKLGHYTAEARLEKPDDIIQNIFKAAIHELHGTIEGNEASEVFHEFAFFCDQQLQNPDSQADFQRVRKLCDRKKSEIEALDDMIRTSTQVKEKETFKSHRKKAEQWFKLDHEEFKRLETSRMTLVRNCLENYLRSLRASDQFDNDALRFSTLWLENHDDKGANQAVEQHIAYTPSRKLALLMNQWTSRLLDVPSGFQSLLFDLIVRICREHPYHGMYQIFASSKSKGGKDETALARHAAAGNVAERIKSSSQAQKTWLAVHNTSVAFVRFAQERIDDLPTKSPVKPGSKVPLRKSQTGRRLEEEALKAKIPPPTMYVELRADRDYSKVVMIARFEPEFAVATGISMPKIVTAFGTDGKKYKQLFKAGNDDLRQDAIMEQVFGAVSSLLRAQQATRQRDLHIRTYRVLPLTATAGVIEFVSNTTPLHDYLLPAHQRHFPNDLKPNVCRKHIQDAQSKPLDQRVKVFRKVCEQFHPVLRYYFQERFDAPEAWYERRLAYTRSTSAISILGHVLGLGDRHGHNILLDESTGEVIHIDLGIAFEQGRVLPVPEVVPFRLTRDIIDAMGITGTEGVFRRCCEFTLEALRKESFAIMSVLDVLRYDPLYSWSLSPLRLKKMQEVQMEDPAIPAGMANEGRKGGGEEAGDAERALLVVSKKLSPTLSVQATVNELIQQAMDEKNLAALFCGWAAYA